MDQTDAKILHLLSDNADITSNELSLRVNMSVPAVNKRIARLKASGAIRKTTILTDPSKVERPITAFVLVVLDRFQDSDSLLEYIKSDPDVLESYAVTGEYDFLIKICARSIEHLEEKLLHLKKNRGVGKSHTLLALMENKFSVNALPDAP